MTLTEYINKVKAEYDLTEDTDNIKDRVESAAKMMATAGCAVLSDEEVLDIILDPEKGKKSRVVSDPPKEGEVRPSRVVDIKKPKKEKPKEKPGTVKYGGGEMESLF